MTKVEQLKERLRKIKTEPYTVGAYIKENAWGTKFIEIDSLIRIIDEIFGIGD